MSLTETDICNSALAKVGAERITSLSDENERARLCKEQYPKVRDALLASHPWNFAIERKALAVSPDEPVYGFTYKFQLPADCFRVLEVWSNEEDWQREGDYIVTDSADISIKYIKKIESTAKYSATFAEALAAKLAADICYSLVQSTTLKQALIDEAKMAVREARSYDAQEGTPQRVTANDWLVSRF